MMKDGPYERLGLKDRVIVVTGGSGGIGGATARLIAARGACVVVADRNVEGGRRVVADIESQGGAADFIRTDVSNEDDAFAMVQFAVSRFGGLHGAFNNAGIDNGHRAVADVPAAEWRQNVDVNLTGTFLCMKHEIQHMLAHGGGAIVNTSSTAGAVGCGNAAAYVSAKHGVVGLTRAGAIDYSARAIRVNAVLPGAVETPMLEEALSDPGVRALVEQGHPIGRAGKADEIAEAVAWLLSDAASYVTGATIMVDGGYTTW
jgi:2,5-dichloro-2,5-cyclohexadiene-1,4-diol dehydrogenase 1